MGALDRRVALVTGASGGIGKAICSALAADGANVVVHFHRDQAGAEVAGATVRAAGRQVEVVKADVAVAAQAQALVARTVERFGRLDVLVNAAGVWPRRWALEMTEEEWDRLIDTNLKGTFMCCQAAGRVMRQAGGGRIVNICSVAIRGVLQGAHYSASKAGAMGLTRSLALEWAPEVLVNAVAPGLVDTDMPRSAMTEQEIADRVRRIPLQRIGQPEDIARAVLFLTSDRSSWITGQVLHVNGGDMMM